MALLCFAQGASAMAEELLQDAAAFRVPRPSCHPAAFRDRAHLVTHLFSISTLVNMHVHSRGIRALFSFRKFLKFLYHHNSLPKVLLRQLKPKPADKYISSQGLMFEAV